MHLRKTVLPIDAIVTRPPPCQQCVTRPWTRVTECGLLSLCIPSQSHFADHDVEGCESITGSPAMRSTDVRPTSADTTP